MVRFNGIGNYLQNVARKVDRALNQERADFVVGLVDLYGFPFDKIDLPKNPTVEDKITASREFCRSLVDNNLRKKFHQHFAVHEVEAWLLAYPDEWPANIRSDIAKKGSPEKVNFDNPPAKFLNDLHKGRYKKTTVANKIFPKVDPTTAIQKCPYLKILAEDLLEIAQRLQ